MNDCIKGTQVSRNSLEILLIWISKESYRINSKNKITISRYNIDFC